MKCRPDDATEVLNALEPVARLVDNNVLMSIAVSLKRIADILEDELKSVKAEESAVEAKTST